MAFDDDPTTEAKPAVSKARASTVAALAIGALVALFAVLNSQQVEVHWLVSTTRTPLIVVIVLFGLIGFGVGVVASGRRRRR